MQAIGKNIFIKKEVDEKEGEVFKGKVFQEPTRGEVISVGEEVKNVKVGQKVIFSPTLYEEIDDEIIRVEEDDIWGHV